MNIVYERWLEASIMSSPSSDIELGILQIIN